MKAKNQLVEQGHEVEIPEGVKHLGEWEGLDASSSEKARRKIEDDLIRGYYEAMKTYDAVLVVNPEKKSIPGYIGGNTLIEMAFAHVLKKKLCCVNPLPDISYRAELEAVQPMILNGNLSALL